MASYKLLFGLVAWENRYQGGQLEAGNQLCYARYFDQASWFLLYPNKFLFHYDSWCQFQLSMASIRIVLLFFICFCVYGVPRCEYIPIITETFNTLLPNNQPHAQGIPHRFLLRVWKLARLSTRVLPLSTPVWQFLVYHTETGIPTSRSIINIGQGSGSSLQYGPVNGDSIVVGVHLMYVRGIWVPNTLWLSFPVRVLAKSLAPTKR